MHFLIVGAGFTGSRVARALLAAGHRVTATTRDPARLEELTAIGAQIVAWEWNPAHSVEFPDPPPGVRWRTLISLPSISTPDGYAAPTPQVAAAVAPISERLVYLSTTGVYGKTEHVDHATSIAPVTERQQLRAQAEEAVQSAGPPAMILRPAAIYGPHRGIHQALREERFPLVGDGGNYTSRIHVDDLAAITTAALLSDETGAYPVADELPSTSRETVTFCCELLGLPLPESIPASEAHETRRANRQVDASAVRQLLDVPLNYPTYRDGIPAAIAEEG